MNIAKSKLQQIVQEELQRLIYEQTGYSNQGTQRAAAVRTKEQIKPTKPPGMVQALLNLKKSNPEEYTSRMSALSSEQQNMVKSYEKEEGAQDLKSPKPRPFVKAWLALKEQDPERFAKEVQDLTPEDRADVKFFEKEEEAAQESAPVASAYRPEAGTSPEADAAFGRAGKRARAKARSAQTKPTGDAGEVAGKEATARPDAGFAGAENLPDWLTKDTAKDKSAQAATKDVAARLPGFAGQPAGTTPEKRGGSIGGGLTMKSAGGSLVPSLTDPEFTKSSAKFAQKMDRDLGAPKQPLGSKMDSLTKASGEAFTPAQRKATARALGEHKLQNLNKLEQIIKETIRETIYNK